MAVTPPPPEVIHRDFFEILTCYPKQEEFVAAWPEVQNHLFLGGVGTGKTESLMIGAIWLGLVNPNCMGAVFGRTGRDLNTVLIPSYMDKVEKWTEVTGDKLLKHWNKTDRKLTMTNGATVIFRPYDRIEKVRSLSLAWACTDEIEFAAVESKKAFQVITGRLRQAGARYRQHKIATSPNGLRGCTQHFMEMQQASNPNYRAVRATVYDNPYIDDHYRETLKESCSARMWEQEGLGKILKPSSVVLNEFEPERHVVPYQHQRSCPHPWGIGLDFGASHSYFCAVDFLPDGRWVVWHELKLEDCGFQRMRQELLHFVASQHKPPSMIGCDRSPKSESRWVAATFEDTWTRWLDSKDETDVTTGIEMIRYMLDPLDSAPRLYLADSLSQHLRTQGRGLFGSLLNYCYRKTKDGQLTNSPLKDDVSDHAIDALRYLVMGSSDMDEFHGGQELPFIMPGILRK